MKAGLFLVVTMALLPVSATDAETKHEKQHAPITAFDIFELSPEQFATMMSRGDD